MSDEPFPYVIGPDATVEAIEKVIRGLPQKMKAHLQQGGGGLVEKVVSIAPLRGERPGMVNLHLFTADPLLATVVLHAVATGSEEEPATFHVGHDWWFVYRERPNGGG